MVIRYCIRSHASKLQISQKLAADIKKTSDIEIDVDILQEKGLATEGQELVLYFNYLIKNNIKFDYLVVMMDSSIINENLHSNLTSAPDLQIDRIGLVHLSMPSSATMFSSNTLHDLGYGVYYRTNEVYDVRAFLLSYNFLSHFNMSEIINTKIHSISYFLSNKCSKEMFFHTILYPSLVGTDMNQDNRASAPVNLGYEILDDCFSLTWNRLRPNTENHRFRFIERHYKLHLKNGSMDDLVLNDSISITKNSYESMIEGLIGYNLNNDIIDIPEKIEVIKYRDKKSIYFLNTYSSYSLNVFIDELNNLISIKQVRTIEEAQRLLQTGKMILCNGFDNRLKELADYFPGKIGFFWHSSLSGIDIMQENDIFVRLLDIVYNKKAFLFLLNPFESIPLNAKRFWIPFRINQETQFDSNSSNDKYDFAIAASSKKSVKCKNMLSTIIFLLSNNISFIAPDWIIQDYNIQALRRNYDSTSRIGEFSVKSSPIELSYYRQAKCYLLVSHTDTMPYSCIESINAGVPFAISKSVGWSRYFDDNDLFILNDISDVLKIQYLFENDPCFLSETFLYQKEKMTSVSNKNKTLLLKAIDDFLI
jgi:hypothetical protein